MPIPTPIPAHDEPLAGDTLNDIVLNYRWRRLLADLLHPLTHSAFWSGTEADVDDARNKAIDLLLDMYTPGGGPVGYHGALMTRITTFTVTTTPAKAVWKDSGEIGGDHDTDGFIAGTNLTFFEVPAGLGGWYWVFARLTTINVANILYGEITVNNTVFENSHQADGVGGAWHLRQQLLLSDGDRVEIVLHTNVGTRDIVQVPNEVTAGRFGLYRLGDSPG